MTIPIVSMVIGAVFLLLSFIEKGIEIQKVKIPGISNRRLRIISGIIGAVLIIIGIGSGFFIYVSPPVQLPPVQLPPVQLPPVQLPPPPQVDITGKVVDIFNNPRRDVIVITRRIQHYAITDREGQYHFSNIPFQKNITLEAYYGKEKDNISISLSTNDIGKTVSISELLILNPIKIEPSLCKNVTSREDKRLAPIDPFERDPRIPLDLLLLDEKDYEVIWCFAKIIGPIEYEVGKETEISYEWYCNDEIQGEPYKQSVGVSPTGWRTRASKKVWAGKWLLKIKTTHEDLAELSFEIYKPHPQ